MIIVIVDVLMWCLLSSSRKSEFSHRWPSYWICLFIRLNITYQSRIFRASFPSGYKLCSCTRGLVLKAGFDNAFSRAGQRCQEIGRGLPRSRLKPHSSKECLGFTTPTEIYLMALIQNCNFVKHLSTFSIQQPLGEIYFLTLYILCEA
jgi:hypothetical protein